MQQNALIAFLQEMFARFGVKSPAFFKVISIVSGGLVLLTGVPQILAALNVTLPEALNNNLTIAIGWASRGILLISLMTTQSKPAAVTEQGQVLKTTDNAKLPFTQKSEEKAADKIDIPVVSVVDVKLKSVSPSQPLPYTEPKINS